MKGRGSWWAFIQTWPKNQLMRVAIFLSLLLSAVASTSYGNDDPVEVAVGPNADVQVGVNNAPPSPLQTKQESRQDISHQPPKPEGDASVKTPSEAHDGTHARVSLMVLQKELEAVEVMLKLQAQKMKTLEQMRTTLVERGESSVSLQELGFTRRQSAQTVPQSELEEAIDRKLDVLTAQAVAKASSSQFETSFVERAMVELPEDIVDVKIDKIKTIPTLDVVALGVRSGHVRLLLASGQELLWLDTQVKDLSGLQLDLASDPPLLVVFSRSQNHVRVYSLTFDQNPQDSNKNRRLPAAPGDVVVTSTALLNLEASLSPATPSATAIGVARSTRRSIVGVARSDGIMTFYALNGSRILDVSTGSSNLTVMTTQRHLTAFANGTSTFVFPLSRSKALEFQHCQGSLAAVTSIAFDLVHPHVVYTGTADGEVLAFSLVANPDSQMLQCKLVHRSVLRRGQRIEIAVFKGYLIATTSTQVSLFTVTRGDNGVSLGHLSSKIFEAPASKVSPRLAVAENDHSTTIALIHAAPGSGKPSVLVLQSLLSTGGATVDSSSTWRGMTTIGMVVIALLTAQYFLRRQHSPQKAGGLSETEQWRELLEKRRRDGPSSEFLGKGLNKTNRSAPAAEPTSEYMGDPTMFGATVDAFARAKNRKAHRGFDDQVDDPELRRKIAEARRETLECTFDDVESEGEY